ncbi:MAG: Peptidoglycan-binding lysin domain protein [Microgenomates bacterium 39_7]|nr:MAG: Peptidoglycan-binding lysin domain protein [Microgenomates bacterium 39_7]
MSRKRVTSRLANKQKKELTKQSIILLVLSILIGVIFLVIVLPNAVRLFFEILDEQTILEQDSGLPPQPPLIEAPPTHVNSSKLTLSGFAQPNTTVHLLVNNQKETSVEIDETGELEVEVALQEGENQISLYATNQADTESRPVTYNITLDTKAPEIKIGYPEPGQTFELLENQTITIEGETKPRSQVNINNRMVIANSEGLFNYRYFLSEGENKIKIKVTDQAGNESETEISVFFRE